MPKLTETQDRLIEIALLLLFFVLIRLANPMPPSDDLRALWMAGRFFETGPIYATTGDYFRMVPPALWIETYIAEGTQRAAYPFIYPPIWAWIMHQLVNVTTFDTFANVMATINAAAMCGCFYLASKMARGSMPRTTYLAVVLFFVFALGCLVIKLPLNENQPQILVSFLVLLAIERDRAGHPWAGGAAMALAAAIKLYPVIFAILWLASGRKHSVTAFAVVGCGLGLLSLFVGGWDQHIAFLSEVRAISSSAVITFPNVTMDSLLAVLLIDRASTELITTEITGGESSWRIYAKPVLWQMANTILYITVIAALIVYAIRTKLADPLVWPVIFVALAWVLPLSWLYHYLPAFAFLPALIARLGWKHGAYAMSVPVLVTSTAFLVFILSLPAGRIIAYPIMSGAMIWIALAFLLAMRRSSHEPPLRAPAQPL